MDTASLRRFRLWPGVVLVLLQWVLRFGVPRFWPDALEFSVFSSFITGLLVILWWAFFSRAPHLERWGDVLLIIGALWVTPRILHPSIATGMMGFMFLLYVTPVLSVAFVGGAGLTQHLPAGVRRVSMAAIILLTCGGFALLRTNGISGDAASDFAWRWAPTSEDRLLAKVSLAPPPVAAVAPEVAPVTAVREVAPSPVVKEVAKPVLEWPGFRGPNRDGTVPGVKIETDWAKTPPKEMWRRPIGPGWSSFAVRGDRLFTQEQRGGDEVVACYQVSTGEPIWSHRDAARFWESNGGPGPRATPTLSGGRVYTFGATGIVNALDAATGAVVWSRNAGSDAGIKTPEWGFASSPLIVDGKVIVAAAGKLVALDPATGAPLWFGPDGGVGYSSPQLATIGGVRQVLLLSEIGLTSVAPADGAVLWKNLWKGYPIVQPAVTADGDVLFSVSDSSGIRRLGITHEAGSWTVKERWTATALKPYFNDFVVHQDHAFGFDGSILEAIDLNDGKRLWKGGRYGHGQMLLLSAQDVLLVLSEEGELALVRASADQFKELARVPAIEGKTWNHPVLAGDVLLVRNGQEMAAFRLALLDAPR